MSTSSELASTAACNGAAVLFAAVVKHAAYPFKVDKNVSDLASAVSALEAMEKDVLKSEERTCTVEDWLGKVRNAIEEAKAINEKYRQRHRFIHVVCSDYSISRNAVKKLSQVKSFCANDIIINLIKDIQSVATAAACRQSPGFDFNANVNKYELSVHLGKKVRTVT